MTEDSDRDESRMQCNHEEDGERCEGSVEANPKLYLSLAADGTWFIDGVGDECADVTCDAVEHPQNDPVLDKSLTAFLDEMFPGGTWQGSDPHWHDRTDTDNG